MNVDLLRYPSSLSWKGKRHHELGPASHLARHVHDAGMGLDDLLRDRHPEPRALLLGGEKGIEDPAELVLRDAGAVVAHANHRVAAAVLDEHLDAAVLGHPVERVDGVV